MDRPPYSWRVRHHDRKTCSPRTWKPWRSLDSLALSAASWCRWDWQTRFEYLDQVEWEHAGLEAATVIAFWVPRDLNTLPGFTTNVEFGRCVGSGRIIYGRPDQAPKNRYLDWLYRKCTSLQPCRTLLETMQAAVEKARRGTGVFPIEKKCTWEAPGRK